MEISVPDLGDVADVEITDILVKVGDRIAPEDPLVSLETEKATVDVPAPAAGSVVEIKVAVGDRVSAGDVLMVVDGEGEAAAPSAEAQAAAPSAPTQTAPSPQPEPDPPSPQPEPDARSAQPEPDAPSPQPEPDARSAQPEPAQADSAAGKDSPRPETRGAGSGNGGTPVRAVVVPDLGDFADVEVIEVLVAEGDEVEAEQGVISLETEKASMDVPAPEPGLVLALRVKPGDRVSAGDEILTLRPRLVSATEAEPPRSTPPAAASPPEPPPAAAPPEPSPAASPPEPPPTHTAAEEAAREAHRARPAAAAPAEMPPVDEAAFARAHASPSVRKLARELGVDLGRVRGSGLKGRIRADDVKAYVKEILRGRGAAGAGLALPAVPEVDFARFGEIEEQPLGRIQRISGARLHASWVNLPHVTQHDEADVTELEEARRSLKGQAEERGIRLTLLAFILRACVLTLEEFPRFKSSLSSDGERLILKRYTHLGFAVDTKNGLVVPVIRDADRKDVYELAAELGQLSERAREGKLRPDDMQGGVFTVSSLGGIGGTAFTPIINAPEVAILGVSRSQWRPVWQDKEFVPRLMLPVSLSYDHRVIDGAEAVRFTTRLGEMLGRVERLLEAIP